MLYAGFYGTCASFSVAPPLDPLLKNLLLQLCDHKTCRLCSYRSRNGFLPCRRVPVKSHNDFSRHFCSVRTLSSWDGPNRNKLQLHLSLHSYFDTRWLRNVLFMLFSDGVRTPYPTKVGTTTRQMFAFWRGEAGFVRLCCPIWWQIVPSSGGGNASHLLLSHLLSSGCLADRLESSRRLHASMIEDRQVVREEYRVRCPSRL